MKLTVAQALVRWLDVQFVERDGLETKFFAGCFGIFGHGNVAGMGQALRAERFPYILPRNEQAMVHSAAAYARHRNRLATYVCTTSIGPGATNMVTGAAAATINRIPVLLLPGDIFARRNVAPVLQQLEHEGSQDISVNDCLRPVSRYWDRINRPEQLLYALPAAMRVLASPSETGAATLALPQDVQTEAFEFPDHFFDKRVWHIPRTPPEPSLVARAAQWLREAKRPLVIAGGGVVYSDATDALLRFCEATGVPVATSQAGTASVPTVHQQSLGGVGVTGTPGAVEYAENADLIICVGTRLTDFTTASHTGFQNPDVRFVSINVASLDAHKLRALPIVADARQTLLALGEAVAGWRVADEVSAEVAAMRERTSDAVSRALKCSGMPMPQLAALRVLREELGDHDVIVAAAGSLPGDLQKVWTCVDPKAYHVEYGYSCMGYEIAGALGVKLADSSREVYALVGDGSYLMMAQELATAVQQDIKMTAVIFDNGGFASIGGLSRTIGDEGFGTRYESRVDFASNAESLGATAFRVATEDELRDAIRAARDAPSCVAIVVETAYAHPAPSGFGAAWDVPVAEVSDDEAVREARAAWEGVRARERDFL